MHQKTVIKKGRLAKSSATDPILGMLIVCFVAWLVFPKTSTPEEDAAKREEAELKRSTDKKFGRHCLDIWSGSYEPAIKSIKRKLRDPDSFQHIQTSTTTVNVNGENLFEIKYRAKNGFGGYNVETAYGIFKNSDCILSVIY